MVLGYMAGIGSGCWRRRTAGRQLRYNADQLSHLEDERLAGYPKPESDARR